MKNRPGSPLSLIFQHISTSSDLVSGIARSRIRSLELFTGFHHPHVRSAHLSLGTSPTIPVPTVVSYLVACRRKLVIYSWKDGEPQEVQVRSSMFVFVLFSKLKFCRKLLYLTHPEQCPL